MAEPEHTFLEVAGEVIAALDDIPSPTAVLDQSGTIRWQNKASIALRGHRVGFEFTQFVAPADRDEAQSVFDRILAGGEPAELGVHALNADGEYVALQGRWSVVPIRDGGKLVVVLSLGDSAPAESAVHLTPRQQAVLQLLAVGKSTNGIASELSLTPTTVRNHIANLLAALGVHSRLEAVAAARRAGLLSP